jgi:HK97 gp10 family phage protein
MINIKGIPQLQSKLNRLNEKVQKQIVKDALKSANNDIVLPAAIFNAPVETGALVAGLKVVAKNGRGKIGSAISSADYKGDEYYGAFSEFGTEHEKAKPWLRPALYDNQAEVFEEVGKDIGKGIEDAAK